jgi:hypothetical protein
LKVYTARNEISMLRKGKTSLLISVELCLMRALRAVWVSPTLRASDVPHLMSSIQNMRLSD